MEPFHPLPKSANGIIQENVHLAKKKSHELKFKNKSLTLTARMNKAQETPLNMNS